MKYFIRTTTLGEKEEDTKVTEKPVLSLSAAKVELKPGEKLHICRHEEGLPCSLIDITEVSKI